MILNHLNLFLIFIVRNDNSFISFARCPVLNSSIFFQHDLCRDSVEADAHDHGQIASNSMLDLGQGSWQTTMPSQSLSRWLRWFRESRVPDSLALPKRSVVPKTAELQVSAETTLRNGLNSWNSLHQTWRVQSNAITNVNYINDTPVKTVWLKFLPVACDCCWPPVHVSLFGLEANVLLVLTSLVLKQQHQILHHSVRQICLRESTSHTNHVHQSNAITNSTILHVKMCYISGFLSHLCWCVTRCWWWLSWDEARSIEQSQHQHFWLLSTTILHARYYWYLSNVLSTVLSFKKPSEIRILATHHLR